MTAEAARLRIKTWVCATVVVLCNVFGNFFLKRGMPADLPTPLSYITALFQPWAALGVALLVELGFRRGTIGPNQYGPDPVVPGTTPRS